ncbi:MAG: TIGR02281 family clan AA aspartic protease [Gammaproteobacteria bacterium]|nr:TIGR02281 family clan AA aspartic protease [Gammaproteobacteria bacterium]
MSVYRKVAYSLCLAVVMLAAGADGTNVKVIALFSNKALLEIDGERKILGKGESYHGVELVSASGRGAVISVEGVKRKLGLNQTIQGEFKAAERSGSRIYPDANGMYFVDGKINGHPTHFLVDTGATFVTMSGQHAALVGIDYKKGTRGLAQTASETVTVWQVYLHSIIVGGIKLSNVEASVIDGDQPYHVLLGNSFLKRTQIQRSGTVMELQKRF